MCECETDKHYKTIHIDKWVRIIWCRKYGTVAKSWHGREHEVYETFAGKNEEA